jgi:hypothetical protein
VCPVVLFRCIGNDVPTQCVVSNAYSAGFANQIFSSEWPYGPFVRPSPEVFRPRVFGAEIYQIDFYLSISNITPGMRGFGNITWDLSLGPGVTQSADLPGWQSDASNTDTNGGAVGGSQALWFANADAGTPNDLQGIIQTIAVIPNPIATDFRAKIGQTQGPTLNTVFPSVNQTGWAGINQNMTYLGSVFLNWNTFTPAIYGVLTGASNAAADGSLVVDPNPTFVNVFIGVPEPNSWLLFVVGASALAFVREPRS